jgi:[Skp1-protein]-hydroxyproline N-acetylglucosaminyltransferase
MIRVCATSLKGPLALNGDYSIQIACFVSAVLVFIFSMFVCLFVCCRSTTHCCCGGHPQPANGTHYVRHRDAFLDAHGRPTSEQRGQSHRKLTMLYYLNHTTNGGQLRIFHADGNGHTDISPLLGTLVAFRRFVVFSFEFLSVWLVKSVRLNECSEYVEHEVLPTFQERFAIAVWASSTALPSQSCAMPWSMDRSTDLSWKNPLSVSSLKGVAADSAILSLAQYASIFVSIVNYRDSEGPPTLVDLFAKAAHPERVFVGYFLQADTSLDQPACLCLPDNLPLQQTDKPLNGFEQWLRSNVRVKQVTPASSTGPCLARACVQSLYCDEQFYLQIDSHMRFRPHWDDYLIALLEVIRRDGHAKPVISTYPVGYELPNRVPDQCQATILVRLLS